MVACRKPCDPFGGGRVQPFGQRVIRTMATWWEGVFRRYNGVLRRARERGVASLATKRLDRFNAAMFAIPNERMEGSVGVAEVHALTVGTSKPFSVDAFGGSPPTFHLAPGAYRTRSRPYTQGGSGGETTDRAIVWGAWLGQTWLLLSTGQNHDGASKENKAAPERR